jgi:hypothetical protein
MATTQMQILQALNPNAAGGWGRGGEAAGRSDDADYRAPGVAGVGMQPRPITRLGSPSCSYLPKCIAARRALRLISPGGPARLDLANALRQAIGLLPGSAAATGLGSCAVAPRRGCNRVKMHTRPIYGSMQMERRPSSAVVRWGGRWRGVDPNTDIAALLFPIPQEFEREQIHHCQHCHSWSVNIGRLSRQDSPCEEASRIDRDEYVRSDQSDAIRRSEQRRPRHVPPQQARIRG